MAPKRRSLHAALSRFEDGLRAITQTASDGLSYLTRAMQTKPCVAPSEFREVLSDIQEDVSVLTAEVEVLERFTTDCVSIQELLGHCEGLYKETIINLQSLENHLRQYGYQDPPGLVREPENPLSTAAVEAVIAHGHEGGSADDGGGSDDDVRERVGRYGPSTTVRFTSSSVPDTAPRAGDRRTALATPGGAGASLAWAPRAVAGRKPTPVNKHSMAAPRDDDSGEDDKDDGGPTGMDIDEGEACHGNHAHQAPFRYHHQLPGTQTAAAYGTTARKLPRPSVASRASSTPDVMVLTPGMQELLAKYDQQAESDRMSLDPSCAAAGSGAQTSLCSTPSAAAAAAAAGSALAEGRRFASTLQQQPLSQVPVGPAAPPVPEETHALYQLLIKSKMVPSSLEPQQGRQQQQQHPPQAAQLVFAHPYAAASSGAAQPMTSRTHIPNLGSRAGTTVGSVVPADRSPNRLLVAAYPGAAGDLKANFQGPGGASPDPQRSTTPLAMKRSEHKHRQSEKRAAEKQNANLQEKLAGLEMTFAGMTPSLRRSYGGALSGGGGGDGQLGVDLAGAIARAKSPAPSRAAAEAAAVASRLTAANHAGGKDGAGPAAGVPTLQSALPQPAWGQAEVDAERVLSPLQPKALSSMLGASPPTQAAGARGGSLPAASWPVAATSTVVGATLRDATVEAAANAVVCIDVKPAAPAPKQTPGRLHRGTPAGRIRPSSPPCATPLASRPAIEAPTPRGASRVSTQAAIAVDMRAPRATPMRNSIAGAFPGMAAAAAVTGPEQQPLNAAGARTPGKASRIARAPADVGPQAANRTPSRLRKPDADEGNDGAPGQARSRAQVAQAVAPSAVPQLRLGACNRAEGGSRSGTDGADGEWQGFPLSRRTEGGHGGSVAGMDVRGADARVADEVTLTMPPSVSQPGTPAGGTPGRAARGMAGVTATSTAVPSAVAPQVSSSVMAASNALRNLNLALLSPQSSSLMSRVVQSEQGRPALAAAPPGLSRIPTPLASATQPRTGSTADVSSGGAATTRNGVGGGSEAGTAYQPGATAPGPGAPVTGVGAAVAAASLPPGVEPINVAEWRSLGPTSQSKFPLDVLNGQIVTIVMLLSRRSGGIAGGSVSVSDLEAAFSLTPLGAKLLANVLVKLGRLKILPGGTVQAPQYGLRVA